MPEILLDESKARESFERALAQDVLSNDYQQQWMRKIRFDGISKEGRIILTVESPFVRDFVDEHFIDRVLIFMENDFPHTKIEVEWRIDEAMTRHGDLPRNDRSSSEGKMAHAEEIISGAAGEKSDFSDRSKPSSTTDFSGKMHPVPFQDIYNKLDDRYRFENFVSAPSNQLAFAGAMALAQASTTSFNPLFIYGGSGLGKTHLLHSIGHRFLETHPGAKVIYMTSEELVNFYIGSVQKQAMPEFRKRMREDCDCLLIDDIQFLGPRVQTQEEFFNIFNALYNSGKPVAMTSDRIPAEIEGIASRLRTRFVSGLLADIQEPDFETRVAILKKKAEAINFELTDEVARYIAKVVQSNVRELQMALNRIYATQSLSNIPMTEEFAANILMNVLPEPKKIGVADVQKATSKYYNVSVESMTSTKRQKNIVKARQMAMYIARNLTGTSFPELGSCFNRDHSTVMSSCGKIENELVEDERLKKDLEEIMSRLGVKMDTNSDGGNMST